MFDSSSRAMVIGTWPTIQQPVPNGCSRRRAGRIAIISVVFTDGVRRVQNHRIDDVQRAADKFGRAALLRPEHVLTIGHYGANVLDDTLIRGEYADFNVKLDDDQPLDRCLGPIDPAELFARIEAAPNRDAETIAKIFDDLRPGREL